MLTYLSYIRWNGIFLIIPIVEGFEESEGPKLLGVVVIGGYMFETCCKFSNSSFVATICIFLFEVTFPA